MKYNMTDQQLSEIIKFIEKFSVVEKALIFGSRALGTSKKSSDVDIVIMGEKADSAMAAHIQYELHEETCLPFFFDIISYSDIDSNALKKHIEQHGKVIYQR